MTTETVKHTGELLFARPEEIDYNRAYAAYRNTSFDPDRRAKGEQEEFARVMNAVYVEMRALVREPQQEAVFQAEMERYKAGYLKHRYACLDAESRCASAFVTGPANFPTARNQKRQATAHKRVEEFLEWDKKAREAIRRNLNKTLSLEAVQNDEYENACKRLAWLSVHGFTPHASGLIQRLADAGKVELAQKLLRFTDTLPGKPLFTKRHSVWKILELDAATVKDSLPVGQEELFTFEGGRVIRNHDENRVQILFDDKPDEAMRAKLKGAAWKWSPRNQAWQRQNTANAVQSAKNLFQALSQLEGK